MGTNYYLKSLSFFDFETKKGPELANRALSDANDNYSVTWKLLLGYSFKIIRNPDSGSS